MTTKAKIAVVLSGCGVNDGSEIHEAVLTLLALDRQGAEAQCFAPDIPQRDVINHLTGAAQTESRNVLVEAARIARGQIRDLADFHAAAFDAIIFPGGFGAAKTLCSFATDGADCHVDPSVAAAILSMHKAGKPIGALCISPVIIARVLGAAALTIGNDADTAAAIEEMGAKHHPAAAAEVVIDRAARIVSTPCYMLASSIGQVAEGADALVKAVIGLVNEGA